MIERVKKYIIKERMISRDDVIGVAISGGIDSVLLLEILYKLRDILQFKIKVIHFHHNVRFYGCKVDSLFVTKLAGDKGLEIALGEGNVPLKAREEALGIEEAGRDSRYTFFYDLINKGFCNKIALGHTLDDQVETILMRLIRGAGPAGITGISPVREDIFIRPLLTSSREELIFYCKEWGLCYRDDQTNRDQAFFRSRIRHTIVPILKELNPRLSEIFLRNSEISRRENDFLYELSIMSLDKITLFVDKKNIFLDLNEFLTYHIALKRRIIRSAILRLSGNLKEIDYEHIDNILEMAAKKSNKILYLPSLFVKKEYGKLIFSLDLFPSQKVDFYEKELTFPGETFSEFFGLKVYVYYKTNGISISNKNCFRAEFDFDKLSFPLFLRNRKRGDTFVPSGMKGRKKLKDFFIDMKLPLSERDKVPLICNRQNIIWVAGFRTDERFKVTAKTENIICIDIFTIS